MNGLEIASQAITAIQGLQRGGVYRAGIQIGVSGAPARIFAAGLLWMQATSAAAAQGVNLNNWSIPLHATQAGLPDGAVSRRRYRYDVLVRALATAGAGISVGIVNLINGLSAAQAGAEWYASPAVNGGAWTPRYRRIVADPLTVGPSSGIIPGVNPAVLSLIYTEGLVPSLLWAIDGVEVFSVSDATGLVGGGPPNLKPVCCTEAGAVGTTMQCAKLRIRIFE